jgi:hypothetical protein
MFSETIWFRCFLPAYTDFKWVNGEEFDVTGVDPDLMQLPHYQGNLPSGRGIGWIGSLMSTAHEVDKSHPALFREFIALQPTDSDAVLAFANRYGMLGEKEWGNFAGIFEPATLWDLAIRELRFAVEIHDDIRTGNRQALAHAFQWGRPGDRDPECWFVRSCFATDPQDPHAWIEVHGRRQVFEPTADIGLVAQDYLVAQIDTQVQKRAVVRFVTEEPGRAFQLSASTLYGLMWLQFARSVVGGKEYRNCRECGTPFEYETEDSRKKKRVFCSNECKLKDYRKRKKAEELRGSRWSFKRIAAELGVEESRVREWFE